MLEPVNWIKNLLKNRSISKLDLNRLHTECERNYIRLNRLGFNALQHGGHSVFEFKNKTQIKLQLDVTEVSRYTSLVSIVFNQAALKWVPQVELQVRYYEDAKMAEVISWCSDRVIPFELSEIKMKQSRDEKWQWNAFFGEILVKVLKYGELTNRA